MITDRFSDRHIGPRENEIPAMLERIGVNSLDELIRQTVPSNIRLKQDLNLPEGMSEYQYFNHLRKIVGQNKLKRSYIGRGYYNTIMPAVIQRNILENPSWYTSYTPYQAEISQGRLEALLNYQTVIMDLTGLEIANASLLDEATAASEAMIMFFNARPRQQVKSGANVFLIDKDVFEQTLKVIETRAEPLGIVVKTGSYKDFVFSSDVFGALVQYPSASGAVRDYAQMVSQAHAAECAVAVAADLLSLVLLTPPGEWGADAVVGSTQRFGLPMGFGGPHAGYFATKEAYKRNMPGRIIGVSKDATGKTALRMALQTREQHIKRERATSNICTAQALLANMSGMYAVYHGAEGLKRIAGSVHGKACIVSEAIVSLGFEQKNEIFFDTLCIGLPSNIKQDMVRTHALSKGINLYYAPDGTIGISLDEAASYNDLVDIISIFADEVGTEVPALGNPNTSRLGEFERTTQFLEADVFKKYHCETEMMRYIKKLERKDFSLTHSMISLGSCTMKLNAAVEMLPLSWPELGNMHPFVPKEQAAGYHRLIQELEHDLCEITGFKAISFQPNSGASGEYAGLLTIREFQKAAKEGHRNVVLIPASAHGTNPASAVMAGLEVVVVKCDESGNVNVDDLREKAEQYKDKLSAFMVTYPSTHGVFESAITEMTKIIHDCGGQVYMDGANMNAQVGLTNPAIIGADVCHLNLHKTFAIPHGGGGPGVGPIGVAEHLVPYLPKHPMLKTGGEFGPEAIAAAPYGSASILAISHAYIKMLGGEGLKKATEIAILNANYLASSMEECYSILYKGENGRVAHEMIVDCRGFKPETGITETDIAKRLMDFGFHAPTLSFPVHGTLMVEPTESESVQELDRFIDAMKAIYSEIQEVKEGKADAENNVLKNAPHTADLVIADNWDRPYAREKAAYPLEWVRDNKFFPSVSRIDDAFGDRNLVCNCNPLWNTEEKY